MIGGSVFQNGTKLHQSALGLEFALGLGLGWVGFG